MKEWIVIELSINLKSVNNSLERNLLVPQSLDDGLVGVADPLTQTPRFLGLAAEDDIVHEQPDEVSRFLTIAIRNSGADAEVILLRVAEEQSLEEGQHRTKGSDVFLTGESGEGIAIRGIELNLMASALEGRLGWSLEIAREAKERRNACKLLRPVAEFTLVLVLLLILPNGVVEILDAEFRERGGFCTLPRGVKVLQLA